MYIKIYTMSDITISIPCDPYLRQWIVCACGGTTPVHFRKGTPEAIFLETFLAKLPAGTIPLKPGPDMLTIALPTFRHKSPLTYCWLSPASTEALLKLLRRRFDLALWTDLATLRNYYRRKDLLIAAWMQSNGIDDTERNTLAVTKRLQRLTARMAARERMRRTRSEKTH